MWAWFRVQNQVERREEVLTFAKCRLQALRGPECFSTVTPFIPTRSDKARIGFPAFVETACVRQRGEVIQPVSDGGEV